MFYHISSEIPPTHRGTALQAGAHAAAPLYGQVAVITGGTGGLGLAIAHACAGAGAAVVVASHCGDEVERAVAWLQTRGASVAGCMADVREYEQMERLAAYALGNFGRLDLWVNNAGVTATQGPTASVAPEIFTRVVATNILGVYHGSLAALRVFLPQQHGRLVNIVGRGERAPLPFGNAYGSSKAWIRHFTLALAAEYCTSGVSICTFNPGLVDTALTRQMQVVPGYAGRARAFDMVARIFAAPAEEPARYLVARLVAAGSRTGLELQMPIGRQAMRGLLREGVRRLLRLPAAPLVEGV